MPENKRCTRKLRVTGRDNPWGSLMGNDTDEGELIEREEEENDAADLPADEEGGLKGWWRRLSIWSVMATLLYLIFTGGLAYMVTKMWIPQDMSDIAGYDDRGPARDLTLALRNAGGTEISFTEGEINRYLRDTCRMRQNGLFSLLAHEQGLGVRIHNGFAELVIDRLVSTNFHQTTAVHLSFAREHSSGRPSLRIDFRGGGPILDSMPRGGSIGQVGIPQRYMEMLRPALYTLAECYPEFISLIQQYAYYPEFTQGTNGTGGRLRLIPLPPPSSD